jgi:hypothetical protein
VIAGNVKRVLDTRDRRSKQVTKGREVYDFGMQCGRQIEQSWQRHLGAKNFSSFRGLLAQLEEGIQVGQRCKKTVAKSQKL